MPDPKKTPTKKAAAQTPARTYIVLHQRDDVESTSGATDRQAIANLIAGANGIPTEGRFVAVPARSWRPVTRKVQTVEKALWS